MNFNERSFLPSKPNMKTSLSKLSRREKKLLSQVKKRKLSPSHNLEHLKNVLFYALKLAKVYQARKEILIPACLLHDLGRSKPELHGKASIKESCRQAKILLGKSSYSSGETQLISQVISEHDQPKLKSKILESRILKDADFLDGFGARGILRSLYWMGESGKLFNDNLEGFRAKMGRRFENLEFPESQQIARKEFLFALVFFDYLKNMKIKNIKRGSLDFKGRFIVFEGVSGTGKETQAKMLKNFLEKKGLKVEIFYHPTKRLKKTLKNWRQDGIDLFTEAFLFIGDRHDVVSGALLPALKKGKVVISLRNNISTLVYQAQSDGEINLFAHLYSLFEPEPETIFYFDLKPGKALARVRQRTRKTGEERGKFENIKDLKKKREKYQKIIKRYKGVITLDASLGKEEIHTQIIKSLKRKGLG